jgi:hypothetical protein
VQQAIPDERHAWECEKDGMRGVGEQIPGRYYAWVEVGEALKRDDLWMASREVLNYIDNPPPGNESNVASLVSARAGSLDVHPGASSAATSGPASSATTPLVDAPLRALPPLDDSPVSAFLKSAPHFTPETLYKPVRAKPLDVIREDRVGCRARSPPCPFGLRGVDPESTPVCDARPARTDPGPPFPNAGSTPRGHAHGSRRSSAD